MKRMNNNINRKNYIKMKKLLILFAFVVMAMTGYAQSVDNFDVGPYEVDYKGLGDFKYRLRNGVDLYKFFGLKKDTVIQQAAVPSERMKHAVQVDLFCRFAPTQVKGSSMVVGVEGSWKQQIAKSFYFNAGLAVGMGTNKYRNLDGTPSSNKDKYLEVGLPLSVEFSKLDKKRASVFVGLGFVPTLMNFSESTYPIYDDGELEELKSVFNIAPRLDFGTYLPLNSLAFKFGIFAQYNIYAGDDDAFDAFDNRCGNLPHIGINVGLVF